MNGTTLRCVSVILLSGCSALSAQTYRPDVFRLPVTGLGTSIVISGDEVFVGRPGEFSLFPMPASRPGGVAVFAEDGGRWREIAAVAAEDGAVGDGFGQVLAVDGNRLTVGSPKANGGRGAVYVFERNRAGGEWRQAARIEAAGGSAGDAFGSAVALDGDLLAVGAPGREDGRGAAYGYTHSGAGWRQTTVMTGSATAPGDAFGHALALNNDMLAVGAPGPMPFALLGTPAPPRPGAAFVFARGGNGWTEVSRLEAAGSLAMGFAVAVSDQSVLAAAPITGNAAGAVYHFAASDGTWASVGDVQPSQASPGTMFGFSLAATGGHLVVGQPFALGGRGAALVFERAGDAWRETQRLEKTLTGMTTFYGGAVAAAAGLAIVGAPGADFFEGTGVVYERNAAGEWAEVSSLVDEAAGLTAITGGQRDCTDGMINEFDCTDVDLVAFLPVADLGAERGIGVNDVWGWTDSLTGKEYAIVGRSDATTFIDLSDPANPVYLGYLPLSSGATINIWRDIKVYKNHAFVVADAAGEHGMQVFDLTQLRTVARPPVKFEETSHYNGIFSAHNVVINEQTGFAYSVGSSSGGETCGGGLHMIDVRDPANPVFAGCFSDPSTGRAATGYSHDAQCIVYRGPDVQYADREICFGSNETALSIADVTDKENPVAISTGQYPSVAYAHQGWVSDDHRYFYMNDEGDELVGGTPRTRTLVWDIEDLDDPVLLTEFMGTTQASDHNLYIRGNLMYQSNYVSGLRIIDISNPAQPVEVGFFDTVPAGENTPGFAGSWSNFPFFDSGVIVVTSMREGVFILKKRDRTPIP